MNRKQKMVYRMWKNYKRSCERQDTEPFSKYSLFRNCYIKEEFSQIIVMKNWYKGLNINN